MDFPQEQLVPQALRYDVAQLDVSPASERLATAVIAPIYGHLQQSCDRASSLRDEAANIEQCIKVRATETGRACLSLGAHAGIPDVSFSTAAFQVY